MLFSCRSGPKTGQYTNPVIGVSTPDPTVVRAQDGNFYLYATEDIRNIPIYKSADLVKWELTATAFTEENRPTFEPGGGLWAPDIHDAGDKYILYYAMSRWGGEQSCGIGCAVADSPEGPFTDHGKLFRSDEIGVPNSIDPFCIEDKGKKFLFWGSFRGIYYAELTEDGLSLKTDAVPVQIAGTAYEGVYIHKKGAYYYLFASVGSCCVGDQSTYTTVVGRSPGLFGPYTDKNGNDMLENHHEILIQGNEKFVGTGHNAEIVSDSQNNDWILYHAYIRGKADKGRVLMLDRVKWKDQWPYLENNSPALKAEAPVFH